MRTTKASFGNARAETEELSHRTFSRDFLVILHQNRGSGAMFLSEANFGMKHKKL